MHAVLPFDHEVTAAVIWCSFSLPRMHPSSMAAVQSYWGFEVTVQVSRSVANSLSQFPLCTCLLGRPPIVSKLVLLQMLGFVHATGCRKNGFG